jgi:hypothetical protein
VRADDMGRQAQAVAPLTARLRPHFRGTTATETVGQPGLCDAYPCTGCDCMSVASVTSSNRATVAVHSLLVNR